MNSIAAISAFTCRGNVSLQNLCMELVNIDPSICTVDQWQAKCWPLRGQRTGESKMEEWNGVSYNLRWCAMLNIMHRESKQLVWLASKLVVSSPVTPVHQLALQVIAASQSLQKWGSWDFLGFVAKICSCFLGKIPHTLLMLPHHCRSYDLTLRLSDLVRAHTRRALQNYKRFHWVLPLSFMVRNPRNPRKTVI